MVAMRTRDDKGIYCLTLGMKIGAKIALLLTDDSEYDF